MSEKMKQLKRRSSSIISMWILLFWLLIGLYVGFSGLVKVQVDFLKEIAAKSQENQIVDDVNGEQVTFYSPENREYMITRENIQNSIFRWTFEVPMPLPQVIAALGFGILGSIANLLKRIMPHAIFPEMLILFVRPIYGALIAFLLLAIISLLPAILTINGAALRPNSILFTCLLGGAFAEHFWSWLQSITFKFLPDPSKPIGETQ